MKKILSIVLILMLSLVLFGCEGGDETGSTGDIFVGGTRGLEFSFNTPFGDDSTGEDIIYETSEGKSERFDIEVNVKNQGEADVESKGLKLKLIGLQQESFDNLDSDMIVENDESLEKIEKGVNYFSELDISFKEGTELISYNKDVVAGAKFEPTVTAYACYEYMTQAASDICYKTSKNKLGTCENIGEKEVSSSGAPIQVTKVTQSPSSNKVNVIFEIKNVGTGTPYAVSSSWCAFDGTNTDNVNKVVAKVTSGSLTCGDSETTTVRLVDGVGTLRCVKTDLSETESHVEQSVIELNYQYQQSTSHTFSIFDEDRIQ